MSNCCCKAGDENKLAVAAAWAVAGCGGGYPGTQGNVPIPLHMFCTAAKLPASARSSKPTAVCRFHFVLRKDKQFFYILNE